MTASGCGKQAPLAYVLAQVHYVNLIEALGGWEPACKKLKIQLFDLFPISESLAQLSFQLSQGCNEAIRPADQMLHLFNEDRSIGCIVNQQGFVSLHTTSYTEFNHFSSVFNDIYNGVLSIVGERPLLMDRMGLRYIDLIIPSEGKTLADYLGDSWEPIHAQIDHALTNSSIKMTNFIIQDRGTLACRIMTTFKFNGLPPDASWMSLAPPEVCSRAQQYDGLLSVLDIERMWIFPHAKALSVDILEKLLTMHADTSAVFKSICSQSAMKEWGISQ